MLPSCREAFWIIITTFQRLLILCYCNRDIYLYMIGSVFMKSKGKSVVLKMYIQRCLLQIYLQNEVDSEVHWHINVQEIRSASFFLMYKKNTLGFFNIESSILDVSIFYISFDPHVHIRGSIWETQIFFLHFITCIML